MEAPPPPALGLSYFETIAQTEQIFIDCQNIALKRKFSNIFFAETTMDFPLPSVPTPPGLAAIYSALRRAYPEQSNPLQVTALVKYWWVVCKQNI